MIVTMNIVRPQIKLIIYCVGKIQLKKYQLGSIPLGQPL